MTKHIVSNENTVTEFADLSSAISYAESIGLSTNSVREIADDPSPVTSSVDYTVSLLEQGYLIPGTSHRLALWKDDRDMFSSMLILVNELLQAGYITLDTPQSLKDKDGNMITLSTEQFKSAMIGYGVYYKQIWDEYNS